MENAISIIQHSNTLKNTFHRHNTPPPSTTHNGPNHHTPAQTATRNLIHTLKLHTKLGNPTQPFRMEPQKTTQNKNHTQLCHCRHKQNKSLPGNPSQCHQCNYLQTKLHSLNPNTNNTCPTCNIGTTNASQNICPNCNLYILLHNNNLQQKWQPPATTYHDINPYHST